MAEEPNEHRFNTYQTIQKRLNNVGIDTSKLDEVDFSTLSRLAGEYKKAALAGAAVGAVAGTPLFGIGALPGAFLGAIAGIGARANLTGVDTVAYGLDKFRKKIDEDL